MCVCVCVCARLKIPFPPFSSSDAEKQVLQNLLKGAAAVSIDDEMSRLQYLRDEGRGAQEILTRDQEREQDGNRAKEKRVSTPSK